MMRRQRRHYTFDDYRRDMAKLYQVESSGASGVRLALGADTSVAKPVDATELEVTELELTELELAELEATERASLAPGPVTATLEEFSSRPNALPASVEPPPVSLIQRRLPPQRR
jgi:hypothetical protein